MWAKLGTWFLNSVALPLAMKLVTGVYEWVVEVIRKRKLNKKNKKKVKDYINATSKNDIRDAYSKLP